MLCRESCSAGGGELAALLDEEEEEEEVEETTEDTELLSPQARNSASTETDGPLLDELGTDEAPALSLLLLLPLDPDSRAGSIESYMVKSTGTASSFVRERRG
jgi:hypothetical protein